MKMTDLFLAELEREAAATRRTLERDQGVAQLVLALPPAQGCTHSAEDSGGANGPIEERHVAQHLEFVQRPKRCLTAVAAGKQKDRNVRPWWLPRQRFDKIVEPRVGERFLGEQNRACASGQLDADIVHRAADLTGDTCARQQLHRQAAVAADWREDQDFGSVGGSIHYLKSGAGAPT